MNSPKTLAEHREYLHEIVRLKLWFLHRRLAAHPGEPFETALRERVDIYRKTDLNPEGMNPATLHFDSPAWLELERQAAACYARNRDSAEAFEAEAFELFRPSIDRRSERDFAENPLTGYQCGFLRHELRTEPDAPDTLLFHIANDMAPDSFLDHEDHIRDCFTKLLDIAEREFHASNITTCTWLNELPKWLRIFPPEWVENMGPRNTDVKWHFGFWGQFVTARGTFNARYGSLLRETGELPFYPRFARCPITSMRRKLDAL